jgi:hypothetical protein
VSQRLTALQAAEPQDSDPEFFHHPLRDENPRRAMRRFTSYGDWDRRLIQATNIQLLRSWSYLKMAASQPGEEGRSRRKSPNSLLQDGGEPLGEAARGQGRYVHAGFGK